MGERTDEFGMKVACEPERGDNSVLAAALSAMRTEWTQPYRDALNELFSQIVQRYPDYGLFKSHVGIAGRCPCGEPWPCAFIRAWRLATRGGIDG